MTVAGGFDHGRAGQAGNRLGRAEVVTGAIAAAILAVARCTVPNVGVARGKRLRARQELLRTVWFVEGMRGLMCAM
jgi:hypothetical protein